MTTEQVDRFIAIYLGGSREEVADFIGDESLRNEYLEFFLHEEEKYDGYFDDLGFRVGSSIMSQFESEGVFEYFCGRVKEEHGIADLLIYLQDDSNRMTCLKNAKELGLSRFEKIELLRQVEDTEFIKRCIVDEVPVGLSFMDKYELLLKLGEDKPGLVEEFIREKVEEFQFSRAYKWDLLQKCGNVELIKECLAGKIEGLEPDRIGQFELLSKTRNIGLIKEALAGRLEGVALSYWDKILLIEQTKDQKLIKDCVHGNLEGVELEDSEKIEMIAEFGGIELIKDCIAGRINGFRLPQHKKVDMIKKSGNQEIIRDCIAGRVEGFELNEIAQMDFIRYIGDKELMKECVAGGVEGFVLDSQRMARLIMSIDDVSLTKDYISDRVDGVKIDSWCKGYLIKELGDMDYAKWCLDNAEQIELNYAEHGDLVEMIAPSENDEGKIKLIESYSDVLSDNNFGSIVAGFSGLKNETERYLVEFLHRIGYSTENLEVSFKILSAFGVSTFNKENRSLLTDRGIKFFGEEMVYSLFKYYIFGGDRINIDKLLETPKLFEEYKDFRKTFVLGRQMEVMDIRAAIGEFIQYTDLIEECLHSQLNDEELKMLQGALKEKVVDIGNKEELRDFPQKRRESIERMIETSPEDAITYLFAGMGAREYDRNVRDYIGNAQINSTIETFSDEGAALSIIKAMNEFVNLVRAMEPEKRKEVLKIYNEELANEFTEQGSWVANGRDAFEDIEVRMRKLYGQELSSALRKRTLPMPNVEEDGVQIIRLMGEEFKLLIHGIDAFGKGSGKFEKREVGMAYLCTSLISDQHLKRAKAGRYYGFQNIGGNALIEESTNDMHSYAKDENSLEVTSFRGNRFLTTDKMLENTDDGRYNEVVLWREYLGEDGKMYDVFPDYIVCFDNISQADREEAKRIDKPIVLIDTRAYERKQKPEKSMARGSISETFEKYGETKVNMMKILRNASERCSALSQQEAIEKIVNEMELQLNVDRTVCR